MSSLGLYVATPLGYKGFNKHRIALWWLYSFCVRILEWHNVDRECKLLFKFVKAQKLSSIQCGVTSFNGRKWARMATVSIAESSLTGH